MMQWGDIMSTVGGVQYRGGYHLLLFVYCGGYHEYRWGVQYRGGTKKTKDLSPTVLNTPTALMISSIMYHDIPMVLNIPQGTQDIPHGTEHTLYRMEIFNKLYEHPQAMM